MSAQSHFRDFEQDALQHLNNAYNLARWLTRNDQDAEDIVQEAYLRAFRFYHSLQSGDVRRWLLKIVRNVYYTWSRQNPAGRFVDFDENLIESDPCLGNPEEILIQKGSGVLLRRALETLPTRSREMLVLRELKEMSYNEISTVMNVPKGTVMSTLSRARVRLRQSVKNLMNAGSEAQSCAPPAVKRDVLPSPSMRHSEQSMDASLATEWSRRKSATGGA
jgi:RNA polymerase sigma factor (sigma-70 family)